MQLVRSDHFNTFLIDLLVILATPPPTTPTTETTTGPGPGGPNVGARGSSGLSDAEMWGIIGACIAIVLIVALILIFCCLKKRKGGVRKGKYPRFVDRRLQKKSRTAEENGEKLIDLQSMFFNLMKRKLYYGSFFLEEEVAPFKNCDARWIKKCVSQKQSPTCNTLRHLANSINVVDVYSASKVANLQGQIKNVFPKLLFFF